MALPTEYTAGTVTLTNGSAEVVGSGTAFLLSQAGDRLWVQGLGDVGTVAAITDNTHLTLRLAWSGATIADAVYELRITPDTARMQEKTRQLLEILGTGNVAAFQDLDIVADSLIYGNGPGSLALATLTSFARSLLDDADAATMRATLLGIAQTQGLDINGAIAVRGAAGSLSVDGLYLQNKGGGLFDISAFRTGGNAGVLTLSTKGTADALPVQRVQVDSSGINIGYNDETIYLGDDGVSTIAATGHRGTISATRVRNEPSGGHVRMRKARGTPGAEAAVLSGDVLGNIGMHGHDGAVYSAASTAAMRARASQNWSPGNYGTYLTWSVTADGATTEIERLFLMQDRLILSYNASTNIIAGPSATLAHFVAADASSARITLDTFAASGIFTGRRANGTLAAPVAVTAGNNLATVQGYGYGSTGYSAGARATLSMHAAESWNDAAQGTYISAQTTPLGSTSQAESFRLGAGGETYFPRVGTTASAANAYLDGASSPVNQLLRSTSSRRYKDQIEEMEMAAAEALLSLQPIWYRSKAPADNPQWSFYGLAAEDVAAVDPRFVQFGYRDEDLEPVLIKDGESTHVELRPRNDAKKYPDGVAYDRLTVPLLLLVKDLRARVATLEKALRHDERTDSD